jgi:hypothetical protein
MRTRVSKIFRPPWAAHDLATRDPNVAAWDQAGWARRKRPKCGTVNAISPRSEL